MRTAIVISALLVSLSLCAFGQAAREDNSRSADEVEIRQLIKQINQAYVSRNYEPFEHIYLDNFVAVRSKPQYNYRAQLIAMMKYDSRELSLGKPLDFQTITYDNDLPHITFFGNTAIVNVLKRNTWKYKQDKCTSRYQATEVWIKRDGAWRVAATQTTTFPCETPVYPRHPAVAAIPPDTTPPPNADPAVELAVRAVLDQMTAKLSSSQAGGYDQIFAEDFVSTNVGGEVNSDRGPFLGAFQSRQVGIPRLGRRDEALVIYDDTAVFMFRVKEKAKGGEGETPIQVSAVLVNFGGRWQIVAAHLTKITTE